MKYGLAKSNIEKHVDNLQGNLIIAMEIFLNRNFRDCECNSELSYAF